MRLFCFLLFTAIFLRPLAAKTVVFSEPGFPTVESEPISVANLQAALGSDCSFVGLDSLAHGKALQGADLLVLPYGSAVPADAWSSIEDYLHRGGNLLILGGQPLHVPVMRIGKTFWQQAPQDTFSRALDFRHTYEVPPFDSSAVFQWRDGYEFLPKLTVLAKRFFAVEGHLNGLGYMVDGSGDRVAAPIIFSDHLSEGSRGARIVALDFQPEPGYWASPDGVALIRAAAEYAQEGATQFWIETQFATLRPGEHPLLTLHLRHPQGASASNSGEAKVDLLSEGKQIDSATIPLDGGDTDVVVPFDKPLSVGFYTVRATWSVAGKPREFYANGFRVEQLASLSAGPKLGVSGDFLTRDGKPFFPVGTNYFTTEENGWDFSGPRNALVWENDFADMERHGVTFVRTGVWMSNAKFVEPLTGEVNERFLRNLEAFLAAAQHHHIAINFTFFAFVPHSGQQTRAPSNGAQSALPNPYLDRQMVRAEQQYVLSVVHRFGEIPWLTYDLINEPSFSNPHLIFHGNVPNGDPAEIVAWRQWLRKRYVDLDALAAAWSVPPNELGSFDTISLPGGNDMAYSRYGNANEVRALDYNLFAQAMFSGWVRSMVHAIRSAGSTQLINVGQDEGGVTNRVLNQFYATSGVSFTTNHTYWQDDALLWDSVVAKYPGVPNITGETGYQPVWSPDGTWRYDELTGLALEERKLALGFAAGSSGAMQWDWAREVDFGMERSDGSAKVWEDMMRDLGHFAAQAAPMATGWIAPQVAIVLPQSLQLSVYNQQALEAQQTAVRALYNYDHTAAYAVGEYQIDQLGTPRLIILPSPYGLTDTAWMAIMNRVRAGSVLLISGPFDGDPHLHPAGRAADLGLQSYKDVPLQSRDLILRWPGGPLVLTYGGSKTTLLDRAQIPGNSDWAELPVGKGKVLFSALPLELNDRIDSVAVAYRYALKAAGVTPSYTTSVDNPGITICPSLLPHATLYVLTSETSTADVSFRDIRSGKVFSGVLPAGRAAILLVRDDGALIASYHWQMHE